MRYAIALLLMVTVIPGTLVAEEAMPASSEFALDLYHKLDLSSGNLFFSPLSIRAALAMTSAGAKGKTLQEMNTVLRLGGGNPHLAMSDLLTDLSREPKKDEEARLTLRIANALWGQKGYPFNPEFVKLAHDRYQAEARSLDFTNEPAARKEINDWVEDKTNKKITDLIPSGALHPDTRLVLTNAVYFNARWAEEFSKQSTTDEPFHTSADKAINVPTMRHTAHYAYVETNKVQAISMNYEGMETSMLILMPRSIDGMATMESDLTAQGLGDTLKSLKSRRIDLSMPRFKIEQAASLGPILQAMGMRLAFDADHADFSGMCTAEPLFIGDVLHKAFVRVDEEGTEAAAATAVIMRAGSAMQQDPPLRVQVDRPFVFVIRHDKTGEILFMGRVVNPTK